MIARKGEALVHVTVNGTSYALNVDLSTRLLHILRNDLGLNGPKYGCGLGECGACSVLIDGMLARSCVVPIGYVDAREVVTLEGLAKDDKLTPVQEAFINEQGAQCGYCLNGMIVTAYALLRHNPDPSHEQIRHALRFNLCRCGAHIEILRSVEAAALLRVHEPL